MTKWMEYNYFIVIKICIFDFHLLEAILKVKSYKEKDHKRANKNTMKLLLKICCHEYLIKITAKTIKMALDHFKVTNCT